MTTDTLAQETLSRLSAGMNDPQISSFPEIIRVIHTLSRSSSSVTVGELAELVEKDAKILVKVLQIANSITYNTAKIKITTVMQAIQMVGFNCVCSIAMATMLLEQNARSSTPDQKEAASVALCAGTFAKAVPQTHVDPDLAFVCASLTQFGRIAVAAVMEKQLEEVRGLMTTMSEDEAYQQVFGLTPKKLNSELLKLNRVPEEILGIITGEARSPMTGIVEFSGRLSGLACDPMLSPEDFASGTAHLVARFAKTIPGVDSQLGGILERAGTELQELKRSFGVTSLPAKFVERIQARAASKPLPVTASSPAKVTQPPRQVVSATASASATPAAPKKSRDVELLLEVLKELRELIQSKASVEDVCGTLMDMMQSVFKATESCLFLGDEKGLSIVQGAGRAWRKFKAQAKIIPDERTIFGVSLARNTTVLIHDAASALHIPDWLKGANLLGSFVVLPLKSERRLGIVLVGWPTSSRIVHTTEQTELTKQILAEVADYLGKQA